MLKKKFNGYLAAVSLAAVVAGYGSAASAIPHAQSNIYGMSANGAFYLVGIPSSDGITYTYQVVSNANDSSVTLTPPQGAQNFQPRSISPDGKYVVGKYDDSQTGKTISFIWRNGAYTNISIENKDGASLTISGVGNDGKVFGTYSYQNDGARLFLWQNGSPTLTAPANSSQYNDIFADAISRDGSTVVGNLLAPPVDTLDYEKSHAMVWNTATNTVTDINDGLYDYSYAYFVSADGAVVAGSGIGNSLYKVFRWTPDGGIKDIGNMMQDLYSQAPGAMNAAALSLSGNAIVGSGDAMDSLDQVSTTHAFRYLVNSDNQTTLTDLGVLHEGGASTSEARAVSADGAYVVGKSTSTAYGDQAFRWSEATNMISVDQWLASANVTANYTTKDAVFISDDGNVVMGYTSNGDVFVARVGEFSGDTTGDADDDTGGDTGGGAGGGTGGDAGGGTDGGAGGGTGGIITQEEFYPTVVQAASSTVQNSVSSANTIMFGAQGNPMRNLLGVGERSAWGTVDGGYDNSDISKGGLALGEFGYGYGIAEGITARISVGGSYSDQDLDAGGWVKQKGFYLSPEASANVGSNLYVTLGGYFSRTSIDTSRGYLNGAAQDYSKGSTDADTWGGKIRFDWLNAANVANTDITPYAGLSYARTTVDGYSETGGSFPVRYDETSDHSTIARIGADFVRPMSETVRLLAKTEMSYQFEDQSAATSGTLTGINDFSIEGQDLKQVWVRGGIGAELDVAGGTASFMVNATTQGQDPTVWLRSNYTVKF